MGFGVWGLGFGVWDLGVGVWGCLPVRTLGSSRAFALEKERANLGQVAAVIRVAAGEARELIADRCCSIRATRCVNCLLLTREELAIDFRFGDHGSGAILRKELVAHLKGQAVLEVEQAGLAAVLDFATALAHFSLFVARLRARVNRPRASKAANASARTLDPGFHRNTQKGRAQILHSAPRASLVMRT